MLNRLVVWLNQIAGLIASVVLAPIAWLPGWLSSTAIAVITGIMMLLMFKYTSNQAAIKHTRNQVKANLLALSLFKDDLRVGLRIQFALLVGAGRLLVLLGPIELCRNTDSFQAVPALALNSPGAWRTSSRCGVCRRSDSSRAESSIIWSLM